MGVIKRQGIKQSLVNFIGVAIGALSTLTIYANEKEAYGLARFLLGTSLFFAPFISLGFTSVAIRFFPEFKENSERYRGFLGLLLLTVAFGATIFLGLSWLFRDALLEMYRDKSPLFQQFLPYLVPLSILTAFFQIFYNYCINFQRITVPAIFQNGIKLSLPVLLLLFTGGYLSLVGVANGIVLNFVIVVLGMAGYLYGLGEWHWRLDWSFMSRERWGRVWNYAAYGLAGSVGSILAIRIDEIMIPTLIDFRSNGIYAIAAFIGNTIMIPGNALIHLASPVIAQAIKDDNLTEVARIYRRVSTNLTLVGLFFFIGIIASVTDLFALMPKSHDLTEAFAVVLFIGLARIVDMITSVNNQIINYSPYYRFGMFAILLMGGINIAFNLWLIPRFGIIGAALATLASLSIYNLIKLLFIYYRYRIQPFSRQTLYLLGWAAVVYGLSTAYPSQGRALLDLVLRSVLITVLYLPVVLYFRISEDFSELAEQTWARVKSFLFPRR
ncbi:MAG: polysaccharide biosynthesis C-terminal domain-containing protein [Bacteroidota bacterium]